MVVFTYAEHPENGIQSPLTKEHPSVDAHSVYRLQYVMDVVVVVVVELFVVDEMIFPQVDVTESHLHFNEVLRMQSF